MNESWCTCEWVMAHIWMRHGAHVNESWSWCTHIIESYKSQWVMSQIWMSHVTNMNESCHIHEWVMSHIWVTQLSHITHNGYYDTHLYRCNHTYIHQFNTHTHTSRHSRTAAPRASARTNHTHTLQHPATLYNILHHSIKSCNTILNPATLYNTLQHSITSCNTRWPPSPHAHTPHWRTAAMRAHYIAIHTLQHFVTPFTTHTYTRTSLEDCSDKSNCHGGTIATPSSFAPIATRAAAPIPWSGGSTQVGWIEKEKFSKISSIIVLYSKIQPNNKFTTATMIFVLFRGNCNTQRCADGEAWGMWRARKFLQNQPTTRFIIPLDYGTEMWEIPTK